MINNNELGILSIFRRSIFMKRMRKILVGLVLLTLAAFSFTGCNTVEGMGQDIESGGERIEEAAD
jgi:predicted small secreted protein